MKVFTENSCICPGSCIFLSGVNGVGKTTLCNSVAHQLKVTHLTASSLLDRNAVSIAGGESEFICQRIEEILLSEPFLLVDGHFVLSDSQGKLCLVDTEIYRRIKVIGIIVLIDSVKNIQNRLEKRDTRQVDRLFLKNLQDAELKHSEGVARELNIRRLIIDVSQNDFALRVSEVQRFIGPFLNAPV